MKGLAQKTIGELIIMVVVVVILGAASISALPYIQDLLAQYFGLTADNAITEAVECSYLRCINGCTGKVISNQWPNLNSFATNLGICPCQGIPAEFHDNRKADGPICGRNAEQYPVEFSISAEAKVTKNSFPMDAKPDCIYAKGSPSFTQLAKFDIKIDCPANSYSDFTLTGNKYYAYTEKSPPTELRPLTTEYDTFLRDGDVQYIILSDKNGYQRKFDFNTYIPYRVRVGDVDGSISVIRESTSLLGSIRKITVKPSTSEGQLLKENDQYVFNFESGYLVVATGSFASSDSPTIATWLKYSPTKSYGCVQTGDARNRACPLLGQSDCNSQKAAGCSWISQVGGGGSCSGTIQACDTFSLKSSCSTQKYCQWTGIQSS